MSEPETLGEGEGAALRRLRKADVATGLVLAAVSVAMIGKALTFPLEGTYAGVKNAWYVSPALFPLIVGGMLFLLSAGLVLKAVGDVRRLKDVAAAVPGRSADAILIGALLAFFIVGLVPRVDFVVATALFLVVFMGAYVLTGAAGRMALIACLAIPATAAFAVALAGSWPSPRSEAQYDADAVMAGTLPLTIVVAIVFARGDERRRMRRAVLAAVGTAVVLSAVFKYGLLVPLPREGLGVLLMDRVADAVTGLMR